MMEHFNNIAAWIREDWRTHPKRFVVESLCWLDSMLCSIIVTVTVPELPFMLLYPMWISGTIAYAWCAYSRGSFGMLTTFVMLAILDCIGFIKVLM